MAGYLAVGRDEPCVSQHQRLRGAAFEREKKGGYARGRIGGRDCRIGFRGKEET